MRLADGVKIISVARVDSSDDEEAESEKAENSETTEM